MGNVHIAHKFGEDCTRSYEDMIADTQTKNNTDAHHNRPTPFRLSLA